MASISKPQATQGGVTEQGSEPMRQSEQSTQGVGSPITNEAYDVLTALRSKLEGLKAYRKFAKDGNEGLWKEMTEADVKCVERLVTELEGLVKDGKFRLRQPGVGRA